jgi:molybdopterin converting factor small subunit
MVHVLAFARVREVLGFAERDLELGPGATAGDVFDALAREAAPLAALAGSTRLARNGALVREDEALQDGDEVALLPPVGGG